VCVCGMCGVCGAAGGMGGKCKATLVIGRINVINTGMGYGQSAHSMGMSAQRGEWKR
jgi:hypothetical protein